MIQAHVVSACQIILTLKQCNAFAAKDQILTFYKAETKNNFLYSGHLITAGWLWAK